MRKLSYRLLADWEIQAELLLLTNWSATPTEIERTFTFSNYQDGLIFATAVGYLAQKLNHHPDIYVGYSKVRVTLSTHDVGGLSPYDFELAERINALEN